MKEYGHLLALCRHTQLHLTHLSTAALRIRCAAAHGFAHFADHVTAVRLDSAIAAVSRLHAIVTVLGT
jgi:hypothetical protein